MEILGLDYEDEKQVKLIKHFIQRRIWLLKVLKLTIFIVLINWKFNYLDIFYKGRQDTNIADTQACTPVRKMIFTELVAISKQHNIRSQIVFITWTKRVRID